MAQRRMFSRKITESDAFTDMPLSSQCLYFHIAMAADDDGFVEGVNRIRRSIGASEDDLKLLFAKSFLIPFESGVVVVRQWHIHNYIQKDRYTPTIHTDEMSRLLVLESGEKGAYVLAYEQLKIPVNSGANNGVHKADTKCIQNVSAGKDRDRVRDRDRTETGNKGTPYREKKDEDKEAHPWIYAHAPMCAREHERSGVNYEIGSDGNWMHSPRARAATAQLVVDCMQSERLPVCVYDNLFDVVYEAMEHRVPPNEILLAARECEAVHFSSRLAQLQAQHDMLRYHMHQEEMS